MYILKSSSFTIMIKCWFKVLTYNDNLRKKFLSGVWVVHIYHRNALTLVQVICSTWQCRTSLTCLSFDSETVNFGKIKTSLLDPAFCRTYAIGLCYFFYIFEPIRLILHRKSLIQLTHGVAMWPFGDIFHLFFR